MKIKKAIVCLLAAMFASSCFACTPRDGNVVHVYMPDGAPAIALSKLMHEGYENTEFTVVPSATIRERVASGAADLAIIPINAAAALYNGNAGIKMLSVNTHGNLYIVSKDGESADIEFSDLVGKKIAVIMQNDVPGLTFRMMLEKSALPFVEVATTDSAEDGKISVNYVADGQAAIAALKLPTSPADYALLAEPQATNAVKTLNGRVVCDVQEQWREMFGGTFPQACLVAKSTLDDGYIANFMSALTASDGWAEEHPTEAVAAVKSHAEAGTASTLPALTAAMIKGCNIKTVAAADIKTACEKYFEALGKLKKPDGTPVLAKAPDDGFYYDTADGLT